MRADREAAQAERSAMVARLSAQMPLSLRARPQWLLWKFERHEGEAKPRKVPYYASGKRRTGTQGDEADRAAAPRQVGHRRDQHVAGAGVELLGLVVAVVPSLLVKHGIKSDGSNAVPVAKNLTGINLLQDGGFTRAY